MSRHLRRDIKRFEKHHAALLLFLLIAGVFFINLFVFTAAYGTVREARTIEVPIADVSRAPTRTPDNTAGLQPILLAGLESQLQTVLDNTEVEAAVLVRDLQTGEAVGINEATTFVSASLYKLFVSYEAARQIDQGNLSRATATGEDASITNVEDCIWQSLAYSDNACGRALRKLIDADDQPSSWLADLGFISTSLSNTYPTTNALDIARLYEKLYWQEDLSDAGAALLLEPLRSQQIINRIPQGLPSDVEVAHKTADLDGYSHDAGIVYSPAGDYVLVVLSGPWPNGYADAPSLHIAISALVHDWYSAQVPPTY